MREVWILMKGPDAIGSTFAAPDSMVGLLRINVNAIRVLRHDRVDFRPDFRTERIGMIASTW